MFLKVYWDNKIKKVNFSEDLGDYKNFIGMVHKITKIPVGDMVITFVDLEDEKLEIKDNLDFEYFNKVTEGRKFKDVFVEVRNFEIEPQLDIQTSQILEEVMNNGEENCSFKQPMNNCFNKNPMNCEPLKKVKDSFSTYNPEKSIPLEAINTELRQSGRLPFYRGFEDVGCNFIQPVGSEPLQSSTEIYKELPIYKCMGDFVNHFDVSLNLKKVKSTFHSGITCDVCGQVNITGKRYKCLVCHNFDICEKCESNDRHSDHPMVRCAKIECNKTLNKLNKKFLKYKNKAERKSKKAETNYNVSENFQFKKDKIKTFIKKSIVPTFKKLFKKFEEETVLEAKKAFVVKTEEKFSEEIPLESENELIEKGRAEKRELLRFIYPSAEEKVIEELARRFDGLNLTQFLEEIEKTTKVLDYGF